jgi:Tol biopolymer transport system component
MSKIDDELTRRFHRAERPVDAEELFESLRRRRSHRERVRRVQAGLLAFAVVATTAGGFVALTRAFSEQPRTSQSPLPANGLIVFSDRASDGQEHLFGIHPDGTGLRQITDFATDDTNPAVSPDGRTIVFLHELEDLRPVIASMPIDGGSVTWRTKPDLFVTDGPAWSPDGSRIVFAAHDGHLQRIYVVESDGSRPRPITGDGTPWAEDPAWSPDGTKVAFSASPDAGDEGPTTWDVFTVGPDGEGLQNITKTPDVETDEFGPTWSPNGGRISFSRTEGEGASIVVRTLMGGSETVLTDGSSIDVAPAWSPDGQAIVFERAPASGGRSDLWLMRPNGSEAVQLTSGGGFDPAWQALPAGSVQPEPTPQLEGRDIGLDFRLCHATWLGGIDFTGDGANGNAWIGVPQKDDGTCPEFTRPGSFLVAVDHTGDRRADSWVDLPWLCYQGCGLAGAADLDADGSQELVVRGYFSIMDYYLLAVRPNATGEMVVAPILVAEPGHEPAQISAGKPLRIDAGGDEGYGSIIQCERYPASPVIVWSWTWAPVEGKRPREVHITRLQLQADGLVHVIGTNDYTVPFDQPTGIGNETSPACGVDWHPAP